MAQAAGHVAAAEANAATQRAAAARMEQEVAEARAARDQANAKAAADAAARADVVRELLQVRARRLQG